MTPSRDIGERIRESFSIHDPKEANSIGRDSFGNALRTLGMNPSEKDIDAHFARIQVDGVVSLASYEVFARQIFTNRVDEGSLLACFKIFDLEDSGTISVSDLRRILMEIGEPLGEAEFNDLVATADAGGEMEGRVDYVRLSRLLLSNMPR